MWTRLYSSVVYICGSPNFNVKLYSSEFTEKFTLSEYSYCEQVYLTFTYGSTNIVKVTWQPGCIGLLLLTESIRMIRPLLLFTLGFLRLDSWPHKLWLNEDRDPLVRWLRRTHSKGWWRRSNYQHRSTDLSMSYISLYRTEVLQEQLLHPYHLQRVQGLSPSDYSPPEKCHRLFSNEVRCGRDGIKNLQNQRLCADQNLHDTIQTSAYD